MDWGSYAWGFISCLALFGFGYLLIDSDWFD